MPPARPTLGDEAFVELRGARVVVRRFRAEDAATLAAYRSDPDVARYQGWDAPFSSAQARAFVTVLGDAYPDTPGEWFQFAVVDAQTGRHVGDLAALVDASEPRSVTVGVTLATDAQGRGVATEALTLLLDYLFTQRGKHRIIADCDPRNAAVIALLERVGMRREAHHIRSYGQGPDWADEYVYAILAEEWTARHPGG